MEVLGIINGIHSFVSGENFFRPMLNLNRENYIRAVKETLKFLLVPAFVLREKQTKKAKNGSLVKKTAEKKKNQIKKSKK